MKASIYGFYMRGLGISTCSLFGTMRKANLFYRQLGQLTDDDWDNIAEDVKRHFSEDGDDEYLEIALLDEQLQWPTFQEFRSAKAHLLKWAEWTRANTKARECGNA